MRFASQFSALLEHPDQRALLVPGAPLPQTAIDEMIRWTMPATANLRVATADTAIAGQPIAKGDWVVLFIESANRDERVFDDLFRFDILRRRNPHLSFGHGVHNRFGRMLAMLEVRIMIRSILDATDAIQLVGPLERTASTIAKGVKHMPSGFIGSRARPWRPECRIRKTRTMTQLRLDGKVALITGAGRGLGRSHALLLAARGAQIVVNDPGVALDGTGGDPAPAAQVVAEIIAAGGRAVADVGSVASEADTQAMIAQAIASFGRIDIIVNNAGNFFPTRSFAETTAASFASTYEVHVLGSVHVIKAAWPHMTAQRSGRIVNTASHTGFQGVRGRPEYCAAKAAVIGFTRSLAKEAADYGIAVNAVAPGAMTRPVAKIPGIPAVFSHGAFDVALVSPTVLWLAHEQCRVTGEVLGAMAGLTTRVKMAETAGFFSLEPTPEAIRDHFEAIMGEAALADSGLTFADDAEARGGDLVGAFEARRATGSS